jgi:para-nitrobenzyl esterase
MQEVSGSIPLGSTNHHKILKCFNEGPLGTIDGRILPRQLVDTFERGEQAPVPLIAGFTSGEIRGLRFLLPPLPSSEEAYVSEIRTRYGDLADEYLRLYPGDDLEQERLAASRDVVFGWASERLVRNQAAIGQPSFLYYFDHDYPAAAAADLTAFHASEVPFVFGTFDAMPANWPAIPDDQEQRRVSDAMLDYWTSFARNGVPVAANGPRWTPFSQSGAAMHFDQGATVSSQFMPGMYELHEEVMCRRRDDGRQSWNWRSGSTAPTLPGARSECAAR